MTTRAYHSRRGGRRGVILILVLGVLGLMAVIGVTFATFTGQSRISSRSFAQSKLQPQGDELMDYALAQLICDTNDVRSAIRGHSLARDMYGNDANRNGYLENRGDGTQRPPGNDANFYVTRVDADTTTTYAYDYILTTNIPANDPAFYGYLFNRWTIRIAYVGALDTNTNPPTSYAVNQSFEVIGDSGYDPSAGSNTPRTLKIVMTPGEAFRVNNAALGYQNATPATAFLAYLGTNLGAQFRFSLDSRWMHAFNGPGMTGNDTSIVEGYDLSGNPIIDSNRANKARLANFRFNTYLPGEVGMDEDYDAVDLENWFLAMQSADGQVVIPSFHRPAAVRYDALGLANVANPHFTNDWDNTVDLTARPTALREKLSRILRPRRADGHDAHTFPDLIPSSADGKITYDVDNDGDGVTDSVWVDLGYPARRNAQGNLFKPLFAFMVIGLNGRIPLNTAGNLAGRGDDSEEAQSTHASHLGNSVSEIDPTYGLQNAYNPSSYSQLDNANVDVRLTQLRNILAGTRPQIDPANPDTTGAVNGDTNFVYMGVDALGNPKSYFMPNGVQDPMDVDNTGVTPPATGNYVQRFTTPVPGRWGEPESVPGGAYAPLGTNYQNEVRPGYSISVRDLQAASLGGGTPTPADAADDDFNSFDVFPNALTGRVGEVGDGDKYDAVGGLLLPVERIRRFLTPIDINGTGVVARFNSRGGNSARSNSFGGDTWGRVEYRGYFRPPGLPGQTDPSPFNAITHPNWSNGDPFPRSRPTALNLATNNNILHGYESFLFPNTRGTPQRSGGMPAYVDLANGQLDPNTGQLALGAPKTIPSYNASINSGVQENYNYTDDGNNSINLTISSRSDGLNEADEMNVYDPNTNLDAPFTHADLEWLYRSHDIDGSSLSSRLAQLAPISFTNDLDSLRRRRLYSIDTWESNAFAWTTDNPQGAFSNNHRFGQNANASMTSLGTNFYTPALAQRGRKINLNMPLPVSNDPNEPVRQKWISDAYQMMKTVLPPRAVDTPEELFQLGQYLVNLIDFRDPDCTMTHWQNPDVFFIPSTGVGPPTLSLTNPGGAKLLQHYGMEYNPVAINETLAFAYTRKTRQAGDTNPGPASKDTGRFFVELINTLTAPDGKNATLDNGSIVNLSGYNPTAADPYAGACWDFVIGDDEIKSRPDPFTGQLQPGAKLYAVTPLGRSMISTQTPALNAANDALLYPLPQRKGSTLSPTPPATTRDNLFGDGVDLNASGSPKPLTARSLAVFGFDFPASGGTEQDSEQWGAVATPLSQTSPFKTDGGNGVLYTLKPQYDPFNGTPTAPPALPAGVLPNKLDGSSNTDYTTVTANQLRRPAVNGQRGQYYWVYLRRPANPLQAVSDSNPMIVVDSMRFPYIDTYDKAQTDGSDDGSHKYDNITQKGDNQPFSYQRLQPYRGGQAVPYNPGATGSIDPRYGYTEQIAPPDATAVTGVTLMYGTKDTQNNSSKSSDGKLSSEIVSHSLGLPNHKTIWPPTPAPGVSVDTEPWAFFPFHDRDFTSPFELTLVPGCAPGLFTKQFIEFAPNAANEQSFKAAANGMLVTNQPSSGTAIVRPPSFTTNTSVLGVSSGKTASANAAQPFLALFTGDASYTPRANSDNILEPTTFPYLVDRFFYTAAGSSAGITDTLNTTVGGYAADGWYRMFEFFEVPSQSTGSIGPVALGTNFDWARQDVRPGMMNLNLLIDEEAFLALLGGQDMSIPNSSSSPSFKQQVMNPYVVPTAADLVSAGQLAAANAFSGGVWPVTQNFTFNDVAYAYSSGFQTPQLQAGYPATPMIVNSSNAVGGPGAAFPMNSVGVIETDPVLSAVIGNPTLNQRMKAAFTQFLWLRHGGSGFLFGFGEGGVGQNSTVTPATPPTVPPPYDQAYKQAIPMERPFRSSSYPDVDLTMLRPAPLPPSVFTDPPLSATANDPGVRNNVKFRGYERTTWAGSSSGSMCYPPPIPARRLFQRPDGFTGSNADVQGDGYINDIKPSGTNNPVPGGLPRMVGVDGNQISFNDDGPNLFIPHASTPPGYTQSDLGRGGSGSYNPSMTQHPYFRGEMMQRVMNLSTVRTHQFAVWITVGFFEVIREGDISMIGSAYPAAAFDILGPEIGAETAQNVRFRSFFVVDRLKLTGFNPDAVGGYRPAVVYRRTIQ